jgi:hypothetical protein
MMKGLCLPYTSELYTYQCFGPIEEESMRMLRSSAPEPGPERDSVLGKEANTRVKMESTYDDYVPPPELVLSYEGYLDNAGEQKPDTSTLIKREGKQLGLALSLLVKFLRDLLRSKMIINHRGNCNLPLQNSKPGTM